MDGEMNSNEISDKYSGLANTNEVVKIETGLTKLLGVLPVWDCFTFTNVIFPSPISVRIDFFSTATAGARRGLKEGTTLHAPVGFRCNKPCERISFQAIIESAIFFIRFCHRRGSFHSQRSAQCCSGMTGVLPKFYTSTWDIQ